MLSALGKWLRLWHTAARPARPARRQERRTICTWGGAPTRERGEMGPPGWHTVFSVCALDCVQCGGVSQCTASHSSAALTSLSTAATLVRGIRACLERQAPGHGRPAVASRPVPAQTTGHQHRARQLEGQARDSRLAWDAPQKTLDDAVDRAGNGRRPRVARRTHDGDARTRRRARKRPGSRRRSHGGSYSSSSGYNANEGERSCGDAESCKRQWIIIGVIAGVIAAGSLVTWIVVCICESYNGPKQGGARVVIDEDGPGCRAAFEALEEVRLMPPGLHIVAK